MDLGRLTWSSVSHSGLLKFVRITRLKVNLNRLRIYFWVMGILKKSLTPSGHLTLLNAQFVRLPWIGSPSQLIADKVSSSVTPYYNAALVRTIFTTLAAFCSIHEDVLLIFQQSNLIYKFQCCCNATYIGHTSQHLEVKRHVPRDICNHTTSEHSNGSILPPVSIWMP